LRARSEDRIPEGDEAVRIRKIFALFLAFGIKDRRSLASAVLPFSLFRHIVSQTILKLKVRNIK